MIEVFYLMYIINKFTMFVFYVHFILLFSYFRTNGFTIPHNYLRVFQCKYHAQKIKIHQYYLFHIEFVMIFYAFWRWFDYSKSKDREGCICKLRYSSPNILILINNNIPIAVRYYMKIKGLKAIILETKTWSDIGCKRKC